MNKGVTIFLEKKIKICAPIFKILRHCFRFLKYNKHDMVKITGDVSDKGDFEKGSFRKMV